MLFEGRVLGNNQFCKTNSRKKAIYMETDNFAKQTVAKKAIYMSCRWQFLLQVN